MGSFKTVSDKGTCVRTQETSPPLILNSLRLSRTVPETSVPVFEGEDEVEVIEV